jgi:hypothetical protein
MSAEALQGRQASIGNVQDERAAYTVRQHVRAQRLGRKLDQSSIARTRHDRARCAPVQPLQLLRIDRQINDDSFVSVHTRLSSSGRWSNFCRAASSKPARCMKVSRARPRR